MTSPAQRPAIRVVPEGRGRVTVVLTGELDIRDAAGLSRVIEIAGRTARTVRLDVRGVTFMDSSVLAAIVGASRVCRDARVHLQVVDPAPRIRKLFDITRLETVLDITDERFGAAEDGGESDPPAPEHGRRRSHRPPSGQER